MRKQTVLILLVSAVTSGLVSVFIQKPTLITALWAATGTKAVVFVLGADCPPGMLSANAAGLNDMDDQRFPLLVENTDLNSSGDTQLDNVAGGSAVMTVAQMPSHAHYTDDHGNAGYYNVQGDGGGHDAGTPHGLENRPHNTYNAGSSEPYWPRYYKLKPCIWTVN